MRAGLGDFASSSLMMIARLSSISASCWAPMTATSRASRIRMRGLERLRRRHELWHILILGLEMPDMPGLRLLEKLRQFDRELAVITLTDQPSTQSTSDAIKLDVSAYMHKPFSGDEMRSTIARVARKHGAIVRAEDRLYVLVGRRISQMRQERRGPSRSSAAARICRNRSSRRSSARRNSPRSGICSASPVRSRSRCPSSSRSTTSSTSSSGSRRSRRSPS